MAAEHLVITLAGTVNSDMEATLVPAVRIDILPTGALRDAERTSQSAAFSGLRVEGTWGDSSQPQLLSSQPLLAVDAGGGVGIGVGDILVIRFNQRVRKVPVGSKAEVDNLLSFSPDNWAASYTGAWLDFLSLAITITGTSHCNTTADCEGGAVGSMRVHVLPAGNLTSFDGTSSPCNASALLSDGSWGDALTDTAMVVFSRRALVIVFSQPERATSISASYKIELSTTQTFESFVSSVVTAGQNASSVLVPSVVSRASMRFVISDLLEGVPYWARVAPVPSPLPEELAGLPPVLLAFTSIGGSPMAPQLPTIGRITDAPSRVKAPPRRDCCLPLQRCHNISFFALCVQRL
jgi:hypothetical protein